MSAFDFFFSLYGMILGLSVAVIATGVAATFQFRRTVRIGWFVPLLALFVTLDIASFWETAWTSLREAPFSYGLLVTGMAISFIYFVAASLVFPRAMEDVPSLDDHFWENRRPVLLLTALANLLMLLTVMFFARGQANGAALQTNYAITGMLYGLLIVPAAFVRRPWLVALLLALHTALYVFIAILSFGMPHP